MNLGHKFEAMHRDSGGCGAPIPTNQPQLGLLIPGERSPYVESACDGTRTKFLYMRLFGWIVGIDVSDFIHELICNPEKDDAKGPTERERPRE